MIEHDATGKFILLVSDKVSYDARVQLQALLKLQHPNKAITKLYAMDPCIRFVEFPTNGIREARKLEKLIREKTSPKYLLLN